VKRILISAAAAFAVATTGHADELSDIQAQSKQLREQNQALTKRLADLERRQRKLETQPAVAIKFIRAARCCPLYQWRQ
jgi:phage shock protein A